MAPAVGSGRAPDSACQGGAIFAGDLKGPKARLRLIVLLASPNTRNRIAEVFREIAP